ncbi:hypothetical protein T440DRAFT_556499 [Plenodomus tracheiphilus IPT5]|uniref:Mediator of RNA polymerase II transcription subunit 13 n=1 Tax=Plenodomus tracheiphilus IPT5 TaxID=1408161 RepID=A0A6A7B2M9_9PLEO|nr:hypothetical protein T440DRAFT_556499 [Plenodomus tracheiphilus IPT5]
MEFLKTCSTNAQAIGDFEAIAFQAFSLSRTATQTTSRDRDWTTADDIRAVESKLRQAAHWVTQDATRPWLWLFKPASVEEPDQAASELPAVDGYRLQCEQAGRIKAVELARPPMRAGQPSAASRSSSPPASAPQKGSQSGGARVPQNHSQANPADQQPPDCLTIYHLLISSVVGLISYTLVKDCKVIALNYRTLISRPSILHTPQDAHDFSSSDLHWLTSISAHWTSSGTFLVSTVTQSNYGIRCLDQIDQTNEQEQLVGKVVRVAPNGLLASIVTFDDPLDSIPADSNPRQRKRARTTTLEHSIAKWKSIVARWLGWRGFFLPNLERRESWVRIRTTQGTSFALSSPVSSNQEWDILWPRALCFLYAADRVEDAIGDLFSPRTSEPRTSVLKWFETATSHGFKDPLDAAQEWALGKADRDKFLEAQRRAKKAEEDAVRRKEDQVGLFPSSPLNTRTGVYGDLQAVSGVYPTPPDGVAPLTGVSHSDTPSVSGAASNMILAPGGNNPAINISAPQDHSQSELREPLTSPTFPAAPENFNTSSGNDDLFGDMEEEGYDGDNINDEDFDFFDAHNDEDVDMLDAPDLPESKAPPAKEAETQESKAAPGPQMKKEEPDPSAALENALAIASRSNQDGLSGSNTGQPASAAVGPGKVTTDTAKETHAQPPTDDVKRMKVEATPPPSEDNVRTLRPSPAKKVTLHIEDEETPDHSRDKAFDPLHFSRKMSLTDAKYEDGRFGVSREKDTIAERRVSVKPLELKSLRDIPLVTKLRYAIGVASTASIPEITSLARAASDDSDSSSETSQVSDDESEEETDASPLAFLSGLNMPSKRKLPTDGNATPMSVTSFAESWGGDWHDLQGLQLDEASLASFEPSSWDWSLALSSSCPSERTTLGARFSMPALPPSMQMPDTPTSQPDLSLEMSDERSLSGKDSIIITQIVTDQIISATLDILNENAQIDREFSTSVSSETCWHSAIKTIFPEATECTVPALAAINDVFPDFQAQGKGQQRPPPRKQNEGTVPGSQIFQINPPFLRVRRADTHWDLLPPAVAFWEHLGLSPASPPKNIVTFCIYPHSESLRPCLEGFLLNLQLAYDSCKLGSHSRVETVVEFEGGLVPCKLTDSTSDRDVFRAFKDTCVQLGKLLAIQHPKIQEQQEAKIDAFVIYMVDPFGSPSALWELCQSFWALFQAYGQGPPGRPDQSQKPDLVLQVVPMKYIASFEAPVILDPSTYINLAREVYDRCPPSAPSGDKTCLSIYTAPAFQLEETIPRSIPFKLLSEPPQDLLRENCYMHLGYAISLDGLWITAAWTDTCGKSQTVVSYHLGTRMFIEIAKEIWQTTIEILQSRRVHWRVCIAKAGVMDREELETWVLLISYPAQLNLFITLLTVDTDAPFKFTPAVPASQPQPGTATPGSTPQPTVSPDPAAGLTPVATPSATDPSQDPSQDPEARLIDVTDETWGITLAHRLHNSNSTNHFSPALISGLLVKRGISFATSHSVSHPIPDPEPGPIVIAVNILWIGAVGTNTTPPTNTNSTRNNSPFPPTSSTTDTGTPSASSPASSYAGSSTTSAPPSPSPVADAAGPRSTSSLMWTPTPQTRSTAENLLKEILGQFRALGLLAKLRGMRGSRHGSVPWHIVAAKRGVGGLEKVMCGGSGGGGW